MFPSTFRDRITIASTSCAFYLDNVSFAVSSHSLLNNLRNNTSADSPAAFTDGKTQFLIHSNGCD